MLFDFIQKSFIGIVIAVFLMLFILTNTNFDKKINRLFLAASLCVLTLILEEAWEAQLAMQTSYAPLRVPLSVLGYSLRPVIPYLMILTVRSQTRAQAALLAIPLALNALIASSAFFCRLSFWYTAENSFMRGPLGAVPFVTAGLYVVVLLAVTFQACRNGGLMEAIIVSAIVLLAFAATLMETGLGLRFIQNPCMATSITFYYLFLHSYHSNRDPLTGALTRRKFYLDAQKQRAAITTIISIDMNGLKQINDQEGHLAGDRALITVADVIQRSAGPKTTLYRIGGDEFMLVCSRLTETDAEKVVGQIRAGLEKTKYRCAIGRARCLPEMSLDDVCHLADNAMYMDKRRMKAALQNA